MKERKRSKPTGDSPAAAPHADDIVYVLPPRFAILGEALGSLERRLRMAMDQSVTPSGHEFVMPESLSHHFDVIQRVLSRLSLRVEGLISENVPGGESDVAQVYGAVGRLEEALSGWVDGYQDLKASLAQQQHRRPQQAGQGSGLTLHHFLKSTRSELTKKWLQFLRCSQSTISDD